MGNIIALFTVGILFCLSHPVWGKAREEKAKDWVDEAADTLKGAIDQFGDDLMAIQNYLDRYHWKGILEDESTTDPVTLKFLQLNGHSRFVVVRPGERIEGSVHCRYAPDKCSSLVYYRVILGIKDVGAQTTVGNTLGAFAGESHENFVLIAPATKGIYQLRFQPVEAFFEANALQEWRDPACTKPIGLIIVR